MDSSDLKWIKKHYGEKFSHLCRELFPTILETEGKLKEILTKLFLPSRELYNDIVDNNLINDFASYVTSLLGIKLNNNINRNRSPEELMDKAGYILYPECKTEADIQKFRHYYYRGKATPEYNGINPVRYEGEELCTFNGGRLNSCRVWFAVKKDVDKIKREDFKNPRREDDYGVSVISIQFSKINPSRLSIKNRYNHTISDVNPDATFGNNLDNIITGLTSAFTSKYNIKLSSNNNNFEIPGYVKAADGRFYKYNLEIDDVYYCTNNIIIKHGQPVVLNKDKYVLFDNFILDIKNKKIIDYNKLMSNTYSYDAFVDSIGEIKDIKRLTSENGLTIQITPSVGDIIEIMLNKHNGIIGYINSNVQSIGECFLYRNNSLTQIDLPRVQSIRDGFLCENNSLTHIDLPNVKTIGDYFLYRNNSLTQIALPNVQSIGHYFLNNNNALTQIDLPNVKSIGECFLYRNNSLTQIDLPRVQSIGNYFLGHNDSIKQIKLLKVQSIGGCFLSENNSLTHIDLPNVQSIGEYFLSENNSLTQIDLPNIQSIGDWFLCNNDSLAQKYIHLTDEDSFLEK